MCILFQESDRKIEENCLMMTVAAIVHHHYNKPPSSTVSDRLFRYNLLTDGYVSVLLVTEAVANILGMDAAIRKELGLGVKDVSILRYFSKFLQMHPVRAKTLPRADILIGIRHSLAHASAEYVLQPQSKSQADRMVVLYKRASPDDEGKKYTRVHACLAPQFTSMCTTLRELFLSWDRAGKYIRADENQAPQTKEMEQRCVSRYGTLHV